MAPAGTGESCAVCKAFIRRFGERVVATEVVARRASPDDHTLRRVPGRAAVVHAACEESLRIAWAYDRGYRDAFAGNARAHGGFGRLPGMKCPVCDDRREVFLGAPVVSHRPCPACRGVRREELSHEEANEALAICASRGSVLVWLLPEERTL